MNTIGVQNWLIIINLIVTGVITWSIWWRTERSRQRIFLDNQLIKLQELSLRYPFLEDEKFTAKWDNMREDYENGNCTEKDKFLMYDVYTEMLFNFVFQSSEYFRTEEKLIEYVNFKSWIRNHALCWSNPLAAHCNRDTFGNRFCDMIDRWIRK